MFINDYSNFFSSLSFLPDDGQKILIDVDGKNADDILTLVELVGGATERYIIAFSLNNHKKLHAYH